MNKPPRNCAGIVIFHDQKTVLVESVKKGYLSYPKGKREKGESNLEGAFREVEEETGITESQIELLRDENDEPIYIDEKSNKGNPSIRYFVGRLKEYTNKFQFDSEELRGVAWYDFDKIKDLPNFKDSRKEVFQRVREIIED